jgi:hypothetical protein
LYEESQEPFSAAGAKRRREDLDVVAAGKGVKAPRFTSYDFKALLLARDLTTPASVMKYSDTFGSRAVKDFTSANQRRLPELIKEAREWAEAGETAKHERETEWELIERLASTGACSCGGSECEWDAAATAFFNRSKRTIDEDHLWAALRNVIVHGPQRSSKAVMIVGESQTGKSTVLEPADAVFGQLNVVHKPAAAMRAQGRANPEPPRYALRNWAKAHKRFFYLDDIRPVELAATGVIPVPTWLAVLDKKWFEVTVSQGFNDGNLDVRVTKAVVATAKKLELWDPIPPVTVEDVKHMKNRWELFQASGTPLETHEVKEVNNCAWGWCRRLVQRSAAFAARLHQVPSLPPPGGFAGEADGAGEERAGRREYDRLPGFEALVAGARIPDGAAASLFRDVQGLGAVHAHELQPDDWRSLPSWDGLRELERRRVLGYLQNAS